jgi:hypothetical protein
MPRSVTEQEVCYVIYLECAYEYFPPNIRLWGFSTYFGWYPTLGNEPKIISSSHLNLVVSIFVDRLKRILWGYCTCIIL